jgi:hypothetical protein
MSAPTAQGVARMLQIHSMQVRFTGQTDFAKQSIFPSTTGLFFSLKRRHECIEKSIEQPAISEIKYLGVHLQNCDKRLALVIAIDLRSPYLQRRHHHHKASSV